jgi:flagellar capping protein FliD
MTENFDLDTGKNIVEALKQQSEEDFSNVEVENFDTPESLEDLAIPGEEDFIDMDYTDEQDTVDEMPNFEEENVTETFDNNIKPAGEAFSSNMQEESQPAHAVVEKYAQDLYSFEVPQNVAVLKKLIAKLPSGVTRQTGAQIIKQTMEALGISIKSVLQEAQQLQEQLNNSAKECQATIQEYKRQIVTLEEQAQSYKKQYSNLNELVSLFIQAEI